GTVTLSGVEAAGPTGRLAVDGTLSLHGRSELRVNLADVSGRGWLRPLTGLPIDLEGLEARLNAEGTLDAPVISAAGSIRYLRAAPGTDVGSGRFDLAFSEEKLRIHTFEVSMNGGDPPVPQGGI
ncbi:MAG: hypothetical protein MUC46_02140, partial [Desulfobacterales bacterium]|nr:hypothetical protein [Desulfobacterales bacterium]